MLDSYYTPNHVAARLLTRLNFTPHNVCDFCAGGGELLKACECRYPGVRCVAIDKSKAAIKRLKASFPKWMIYRADFLKDKQLAGIRGIKSKFDLVVLNPPFTCRGSVYKIQLDGLVFTASKALLFLSRALKYLGRDGHMLAVLPTGVLYSQRDADLVRYLKMFYGFHVYQYFSHVSFCGKTPNVFLVDLHQRQKIGNFKLVTRRSFSPPVYLHRGSVNVADAKESKVIHGGVNSIAYLHTINLQDGKVFGCMFKLNHANRRVIRGPAVLLPRVGVPQLGKIVILRRNEGYVLSDCVIGVLCRNYAAACKVKRQFVVKSKALFSLYRGTGARYITLKNLDAFIRRNIDLCLLKSE